MLVPYGFYSPSFLILRFLRKASLAAIETIEANTRQTPITLSVPGTSPKRRRPKSWGNIFLQMILSLSRKLRTEEMVLSRTSAPQHNENTASFPPVFTYLSEYQVASIVQEANHACFLVPENNLSCGTIRWEEPTWEQGLAWRYQGLQAQTGAPKPTSGRWCIHAPKTKL